MRTTRVVTNHRCNQGCTYCTFRRAHDDLAAIQPARVAALVDAALAEGAVEIVLTGGEPTLRRDLEAIVARAREGGAAAVTLATNATLVDAARAAALRRAGLTGARVNLAGWGDALDAVTRDPGGFDRTLRGLEALAAAGVPLTLEAAVTRSTAPGLAALPARVAGRLGAAVSGLVLVVPTASPEPRELLSCGEAAAAAAAVDDAARAAGVPVQIGEEGAPPPCAVPALERRAHLFALSPGGPIRPGSARVEACAACLVSDRCAGLPEPWLAPGLPPLAPVRDERLRRRLSRAGAVEDQVRRELVTPNRLRHPVHGDLDEDVIRVLFRCNQACRFCFVSTHLPAPPEEAVRRAIADAVAGGRAVALSGGEPTLHPDLPALVRLARGAPVVTLQTNAVRLAEGPLAATLREAGLDEAFVSLHAATAATSDGVTGAPGTFERTLAGADRLVAAGVQVRFNFVLCGANAHEFPAFVRLVATRWPRASATLSLVAPSTDLVPRDPALVPRYSDVLPVVEAGLAEAARLGLEVEGLEAMCGFPLCLAPGGPARAARLPDRPEGFARGEFLEAAACRACDLRGRCFGLRRGYVELHGEGELRPVHAAAGSPRGG